MKTWYSICDCTLWRQKQHIETDIKRDFRDVLIRPKGSDQEDHVHCREHATKHDEPQMELRFLTKNDYKFSEFKQLIEPSGHVVVKASFSVDEIQTEDMEALVRDKAAKAFERVKRPIFVDHTGLHFDFLSGFPGGLTAIFWDKLKNQRLAEIIGRSPQPQVTAVTLLGYCDGRKIHLFRGAIEGTIAVEPRGPEGFQWDPIFIPKGHSQTFAEMGDKKNEISMRKLAVDELLAHLGKTK